MSTRKLVPWLFVGIAGSCALPELVVDPSLDEDEDDGGGESGTGFGGTRATGGRGGTSNGGASGNSSTGGGQGGSGGADSGGGSSGTDSEGGSNQGGETTGGAGGTDGTGGRGGTTNGGGGGNGGMGGTPVGGTGGAGQGGTGPGGAGQGGTGPGGTGGAGKGGTGGSGGTAGKGGTSGTSGTSGTGGAGTGGGGSKGITIGELVGPLDGYLAQFPCMDNPATDDCNSDGAYVNGVRTACSGNSLTVQHDYTIGGVPGAIYGVTMHFYGIASGKQYGTGVIRDAGTGRPGNQDTGASPTPWAVCMTAGCTPVGSTYDTREIHVYNQNNIEVATYFLNSDTMEQHLTYVLNYEKTISVVGGGRIRIRHFDMNCRLIKNCGSTANYPCAAKARSVNISAAIPQPPSGVPPTGFTQPGLGETNDHAGQWLLIDVTAVNGPL